MTQRGTKSRHTQEHDQEGRPKPDPKPPGHILELGIPFIFERNDFGFERHPANPASPWSGLKHLRVHRTDVLDYSTGWNRHDARHALLRRSQIVDRIGPKLSEATRRTEVVGLPLIRIGTGCCGRLHRHPAHGIDSRCGLRHGWDRLHHWKGSSCGRLSGTYQLWLQRPLRIGLEPFQAGQAAKVVALASMVVTSGCRSRIDRHPADWIDCHLSSEGVLSLKFCVLSFRTHRNSTI